ncbi:uroporphyrin-III C-methyltransferase [Fomitopsis serialis]|uniref:uroporphyrin-III C-methyltransferase n=1 Tax=Fomitopsis serialis TaxID=139415 RepID=UPI00200870DD|nr:uroporphyrin-III C-methyltransferase [Neoantrodia serialis]KAH9929786.1 uroporphyrin-III C-methyltransferase [Neoantrodia serialis]
MAQYPTPAGGASLLLSFKLKKHVVVIVGSNTLAASRAFAALEADSTVVVVANAGLDSACEELRWRADKGQLSIVDLNRLPCSVERAVDRDAQALDDYLGSLGQVRLVCVTDTLLSGDAGIRRTRTSAQLIAHACRLRNIPLNVTDMPDLCDFSFLSTHRFQDHEAGTPSSLQVGVTTNGQGCRLASRLRRDIVAALPKEVGGAVANVAQLRIDAELNEEAGPSTPNLPVAQRCADETAGERARRRMKWVAQVSEYWPIPKLAKMTSEDMAGVLDGQNSLLTNSTVSTVARGRIFLVGSGPGHPSLLTVATRDALTKHADLVLSDKLVPAAVLAIIPSHVEVRIARKFPGNADYGQAELMEAAIDAARRGLTVVRLKQGDPSVYGRAGEEILYFRERGFEPIVVPGVSSVLAGPTFAGIPVTQRGAAESFIVCTGVGRGGKQVQLPGYVRSRTLVILMGVARLQEMLDTLLAESGEPATRRDGVAFPACTPMAIVERASMPDQRVTLSTIRDIAAALESGGEQRPPGMIVVGWSIMSLWGKGDVSVLEPGAPERDEARIQAWLGEQRWRIVDGLDNGWANL